MSQIWMSHGTYTGSSRACRLRLSHVTSMIKSWRPWMSHVAYMNESCHLNDWVTSHIWMSHVTPIGSSSAPQPRSSHVTSMNKSWHLCLSHVTYMNESRHIKGWVTSHVWISHVTLAGSSSACRPRIAQRTTIPSTRQQKMFSTPTRAPRARYWSEWRLWLFSKGDGKKG